MKDTHTEIEFDRATLLEYLSGTLNVDTAGLADDTPLFSSGHIDSFSMIDLITYIETRCGIQISPGDITLDNLDSIERIVGFVRTQLDG